MMLLNLFWTFFKIGAFTFGGGYAMIALIQSEITARGWMTAADLVNFIAIAESTPGPIAVNMATFVGSRIAGLPGALCATLGVVLPSFVVILIVARCFDRFRKSAVVKGCLFGLKAAVVAMIATALLSVGETVFFPGGVSFGKEFFLSLGLFTLCAVLAFKKKHPILIICLSAALGIALGYGFGL